jgi:hypothetical protein
MKKTLLIPVILCTYGAMLTAENLDYKNPGPPQKFFMDASADSDIDPGAENWRNGFFESISVDKAPVYRNFHQWLTQMTRLYEWHLLKAEPKDNYYFALFDVAMDDTELAFCFRHNSGKDKRLDIEVYNEEGLNVRQKQWGPNASLIQEYKVWDKDTGQISKTREFNGYVIRLQRFPRHLRVVAREVDGKHKVVFDEKISNIIDSVRGIEDIMTNKLPDTGTLDKWLKVVSLRSWKVLNKASGKYGFFAVFKIDDQTFAFCRQLRKSSSLYDRKTTLELVDPNGRPMPVDLSLVRTLNRRYRITKMVDNSSQTTRYSIIDGSKYRAKNKLPDKFRIRYIMHGDKQKPVVYFDEVVNFN